MYVHEHDQTFYTCLVKLHSGITATMIQLLADSKTQAEISAATTQSCWGAAALITQSMQKRLGIDEVKGNHLNIFWRKNDGFFHVILPSRIKIILLLKLFHEQW